MIFKFERSKEEEQLLILIGKIKPVILNKMENKFIKAMWWDIKNDKPHACLIEGNKETIINLGYFYEDYNLTEKGKEAFEIWKSRNK